jgi:hypothetical protein
MPADTISKTLGKNVTEITVIAPLKQGGAAQLRAVLANLQTNPASPINQIDTIHFARWVIFDNDTRMLFTSNFDGPLEAYLRDFSVKTPQGMDAIFGNCEGYPAGGCADFEAFKAYVREHQVVTDLFYAAYPESTVRAVRKALKVNALAIDLLDALA